MPTLPCFPLTDIPGRSVAVDKFEKLMSGEFSGYNSQSEAGFVLYIHSFPINFGRKNLLREVKCFLSGFQKNECWILGIAKKTNGRNAVGRLPYDMHFVIA